MIIHNKCLDNGETKYEKTVALLYKRNGGIGKLFIAPPPAVASEIVHQDALAYSEFSQGVG